MFIVSSARTQVLGAALSIALMACAIEGRAQPQVPHATYQLNIPSQNLNDALQALALASRHKLFYQADIVSGKVNAPLNGTYTAEEAVRQMLSGTDLRYELSADGVVFIRPSDSPPLSGLSGPTAADQNLQVAQSEAASSQQSAGSAATDSNDSAASADKSQGAQVEEVIVTATKRQERLIDVPQSVTVLSSEELEKLGATQFRDLANTIPGLSFNSVGAGFNQISLRGVTPTISSTVGIYVDEVPYGSSSAHTQSNHYSLDVGLFDLDRIEVLRGPQGTLYGASTMGGLLKYVTRQPDASRFGIDVRAGTSSTEQGDINYNGSAALNAPIVADKLALRATGYYSQDGGYVDNLALDQKDVNRSDVYGARGDLLYTPSEAFSIRGTVFLQNIDRDGWGTADYTIDGIAEDGSLDQRRLYEEPYDQRFRLFSATVSYDLGSAALSSISSYQTVRTSQFWDLKYLVPIFSSVGLPFSAIGTPVEISTDKFTQEIRFAGERVGPFEWLLGGFYTHEDSGNLQGLVALDLAGQPAGVDLFTGSYPSRFEELAAFGNLTWYLSEKFDITGGIRYAENRQEFEEILSGIFTAGSHPPRRSSESVATYLANARYHFNDRATGYLRYATGYRPGGPNFFAVDPTTGVALAPDTFESDRLKSYEAGIKLETEDQRFGIDVAGYHIDWSNMQIGVAAGGFAVFGNAPGEAEVNGGELTLTARPSDRLTATGAFAYKKGKLQDGEPVPGIAPFTAAVNVDYELGMGNMQPIIGTTVRYMDERVDDRVGSTYRLSDYTSADVRAAFLVNQVNVQLYVHNLFDDRGPLSVIPHGVLRIAPLQPRTFGIEVGYRFD